MFSTERGNHFGRALVNSLIIGAVTTVIALIVGVFAAYALARLEFRGKCARARLRPRRLDVPGRRAGLAAVPAVHRHRLVGTYQALIIPNISFVLPLTIYTLTAFFREMPWELEEAAKIDGATPGRRSGR